MTAALKPGQPRSSLSFNELLELLSKPLCFLYFVSMSNVSHVFADCDRDSNRGMVRLIRFSLENDLRNLCHVFLPDRGDSFQ